MNARETTLAEALASEYERMKIANDVLHDVLMDHRANADVRFAAITLIAWLTIPAEKIASALNSNGGGKP